MPNQIQNSQIDSIYRTYHPKVRSFIRARINNSNDVDNLVSEIFEKIVLNYERFDPDKSSVATWVFTISRNSLIDYYKHQSVAGTTCDVEDYASQEQLSSEDSDQLTYENLDLLSVALQQLKERERSVLVMKFYYGFDLNEIALRMDLSYANVRVIQTRALAVMKSYLGKMEKSREVV